MNRYKKLLSNTAVFAAGQFLSKAMVYLLMPLYTAVLTKEQSSAADMIQQVGNFLMPVAALGLCEGILRFAMDSGVDGTDPVALKKKVFSSSMTVMFLSTLLFAALAPLALLFGFDAGDPDDASDDCFYMVDYDGSNESLTSEGSDINIVAAGLNILFCIVYKANLIIACNGKPLDKLFLFHAIFIFFHFIFNSIET